EDVGSGIRTVKNLIGRVPLFGICLGHQLIGLACGAKTFKMKFGHRGSNQPVINHRTGRVESTSQNHGFAIDADSLQSTGLEITHTALNDRTVEGIRHVKHPVFSVQHHPEASAGPHDSEYLFGEFVTMMETKKEANNAITYRHPNDHGNSSGPIIIGQAAEFDYAGTQACLALREEGYRVILVNSNPATIMTDKEIADVV